VWLSIGMSLAGFGLTLRSLESRTGRMSLEKYHGLYEHMPGLATFFLLMGLASIGFPGTVGFVGAELLVEGAVGVYPVVGMLVVLAGALNGIAVVHAYFRLFTGTEHRASISLQARWPEKIAILTLSVLIIGGGLWPQPGVLSRYHAATELIARRQVTPDRTDAHATAVGVQAWGALASTKVNSQVDDAGRALLSSPTSRAP
jgi:NADH-quinone oxidoreductase subunit M